MAEVKRQVVITLNPEEHQTIISVLHAMSRDEDVPQDYRDFALLAGETLND